MFAELIAVLQILGVVVVARQLVRDYRAVRRQDVGLGSSARRA